MGSDNLFHKRKVRRAASLRRTAAKRDSYDTVLIVCEGEKTEPYYFKELRDDLRLSHFNIEITGSSQGSAPINVVNHALQNHKNYDKTFCVFDQDQHSSYQKALDKIRKRENFRKHSVTAITSVPCFEFWLLLHFRMTTRQFAAVSGSICDQVIKDLKNDLPDYHKGYHGIYRKLKTRLPQALKNARKVAVHCETVGTDHPSTRIHELVIYLQTLKER
jgi:hypothetical protein